jgi:hypothetical protein
VFPIAVLQGRAWITGADWKIAGQLTDVSATMRAQMQAAVDAHRRETAAKANAQAAAQVIAETRLAGDRQERVLHAIKRKLKRVYAATEYERRVPCDSTIRADFKPVFTLLVDKGLLVCCGGGDDRAAL